MTQLCSGLVSQMGRGSLAEVYAWESGYIDPHSASVESIILGKLTKLAYSLDFL